MVRVTRQAIEMKTTDRVSSGSWRGSGLGGALVRPAPGEGFTLIELLTVISIIALVAGLVVGLAPAASRSMKLKRVQGDLRQMASAIEEFKQQYGFYPPDNRDPATQRNADPAINPLYYELTGVLFNESAKTYQSPERPGTLTAASVEQVFRVKGFLNAASSVQGTRNFFRGGRMPAVEQVTVGAQKVDVFVAPVRGVAGPTQANPWRYVSSSPTNNPSTFDLWAEVVIGKDVTIISNWD